MEQQSHFKLQVFGSMKPDVFAGFVDCLGVVGGFDLFPFQDLCIMIWGSLDRCGLVLFSRYFRRI